MIGQPPGPSQQLIGHCFSLLTSHWLRRERLELSGNEAEGGGTTGRASQSRPDPAGRAAAETRPRPAEPASSRSPTESRAGRSTAGGSPREAPCSGARTRTARTDHSLCSALLHNSGLIGSEMALGCAFSAPEYGAPLPRVYFLIPSGGENNN